MTYMDMPLPEPDFKLMWRNGEYKVSRGGIDYADCYSADQVRDIVAAEVAREREECAKLCESADVASDDDALGVQKCIAAAIRKLKL